MAAGPACPHRPPRTAAPGTTPVDRLRQLHQRVAHVDDRVQPRAQKIGLSRLSSFPWSHRSLRCDDGITTRDSTESSKMKLQAFGQSKPEILQSQSQSRPENRFLINRLDGSSRTT